MDQVNNTVANNTTADAAYHQGTTIPQSEPLHQYTTADYPFMQQPVYPVQQDLLGPEVVAAGIMGVIVAGTGSLGSNLHRVEDGDMTMTEAATNSLVKGAAGGVAAAAATAAAKSLTNGGITGLAVTLATATGVSYLLSK